MPDKLPPGYVWASELYDEHGMLKWDEELEQHYQKVLAAFRYRLLGSDSGSEPQAEVNVAIRDQEPKHRESIHVPATGRASVSGVNGESSTQPTATPAKHSQMSRARELHTVHRPAPRLSGNLFSQISTSLNASPPLAWHTFRNPVLDHISSGICQHFRRTLTMGNQTRIAPEMPPPSIDRRDTPSVNHGQQRSGQDDQAGFQSNIERGRDELPQHNTFTAQGSKRMEQSKTTPRTAKRTIDEMQQSSPHQLQDSSENPQSNGRSPVKRTRVGTPSRNGNGYQVQPPVLLQEAIRQLQRPADPSMPTPSGQGQAIQFANYGSIQPLTMNVLQDNGSVRLVTLAPPTRKVPRKFAQTPSVHTVNAVENVRWLTLGALGKRRLCGSYSIKKEPWWEVHKNNLHHRQMFHACEQMLRCAYRNNRINDDDPIEWKAPILTSFLGELALGLGTTYRHNRPVTQHKASFDLLLTRHLNETRTSMEDQNAAILPDDADERAELKLRCYDMARQTQRQIIDGLLADAA